MGGALIAWACAQANPPEVGDPDARAGTGGTLGKAGSSAQSGSGGSGLAGTGGSSASGGSFATGGSSASGGSGSGSGGTSGAAPTGGLGGLPGSGGGSGSSAGGTGGGGAGGANSTGGAGGNTSGGGGNGGVASGGGGGSAVGGTGTGGIPNDPNWMPPDMSAAKIVVLYKCDQRTATGSSVAMTLYLKNQTDTAYDMSDVTVRYWMSSEPPPRPERYHSASNLSSTSPPVFVPNMAVSYLEWSFGATGTLPVYVDQNTLNNNGVLQAGVQSTLGIAQFNQANDWSFDPTAMAAKPNPKITVYDGDTLIYGCEPSHVCAEITPEPGGEAGAGGQSGN